MAGIGFELRKLLKKDSLLGLVQAYSYAGVIGSGPWVLSIVGILMVGLLSRAVVVPEFLITQFQVSVTYLIASSLILTGVAQLAFTRFVSDRLFEKRDDLVMSNFNGLLLWVLALSGAFALLLAFTLFAGLPVAYRLLMIAGFVLLCGIWVATIFLSGLKLYRAILLLYALGYAITVAVALLARPYGLEGLLGGFVLGHFVLLVGMWMMTAWHYRSPVTISYEFAKPGARYPSLMVIGLLYNLGVWADKFMFWSWPETSDAIIGPLRASVIYDLPVFMAYLSIIPGMAVFLVRIETDFVEYYDRFFDAVRTGGSLEYIEDMRDEMVYSIRQGLAEIGKIQTLAMLVSIVAAPAVFAVLEISELYLPLLYIQTLAASMQVGLLALLNVFFYLDQRRTILGLCAFFCIANIAFTALSFKLGASFYGYGYAVAVLLTLMLGLRALDRKLGRLEYETFMLQ
ncbi:MAG: exopolysaccharide Pel transporter PelG [Gammaproteobacteria bacterium]|jgi:polysaccharide biosynthesis protein PelG|nr:exopolysaccharide Pel transporter PelG [Gammaproteobacteria bacterium]MBU0771734.1 exopolysaccharide Pel transporter PelG [Gammaproteobacteria bacterium]MBU0857007.1 exopolysaccharide Pel transporter PelG [Gammaproteobacteria bacterium]MBU1845788.1 exopolysaccharide Pel transporter PelG [Gammaproteobacteria bacterium]